MRAEPRETTSEVPAGTVFGKYEIVRKLATGGMAEIYLARASGAAGFEKLVVLKRILPNLAEDPTFVAMFLDEARLAATLQHPNIADVFDVGEDDGSYFFTMEYVHGQDVRMIRGTTHRHNEGVPLAISLAIVHGVALALDHAHEKKGPDGWPLNLVHRDVSASNIMVSYDGAVKLLDFGIARATSSAHKTRIGSLKGKIPYMSPEQCRCHQLDRRSDLFSLGIVLYELTVGRRPFRGESDFEIMDQIVHGGAPLPSSVVPGYPDQLQAIVMKLLATSPDARYSSGEELLHDLDQFIGEHRLWLSAKPLGKWMRQLFADRVEAWERAQEIGTPFIEHVAETVTSPSQRSELLTPPSAFPDVSQQLPVFPTTPVPGTVRASSELIPRSMDDSASGRSVLSGTAFQPEPRSRKTIAIAFVVTLVLGGGAFGAHLYRQPDNSAPATTDESSAPPRLKVEAVEVVTPPADRAPATPPAAANPVVSAQPAAGTEPEIEIEPAAPPRRDLAPPARSKPPPPRRWTTAGKPSAGKPPAVQPKPADKPPELKPKPPEPSKEPTWDPNSPFLPQ